MLIRFLPFRFQMKSQNSLKEKTSTNQKSEHHMAKGTLYFMIAQVIFLMSGYVIHFGVARMITPEEYGRLGVILAILMMTQIFLQKGIPDAVVKYISEGRDSRIVKKKALKVQLILSFIFTIVLISIAPIISNLLNDNELTNYIYIFNHIVFRHLTSLLQSRYIKTYEATISP